MSITDCRPAGKSFLSGLCAGLFGAKVRGLFMHLSVLVQVIDIEYVINSGEVTNSFANNLESPCGGFGQYILDCFFLGVSSRL